ncbi:hypothetical protein Zm00014a_025366 [Zea mays]|uniref:Uncharacterized protein n=1 Tax=Zea mays TaxID=4577 RepID=A0A3L6G3X8_MAIZE|nr:hypothetical protein Zm00014a_025366 [Zea mays]
MFEPPFRVLNVVGL